MAGRKIDPKLKAALEYGPILLFFVAFYMLKDRTFTVGGNDYSGFMVVTAGFIPLLLASIGALWRLTGKLSKMQAVTAVLVVVFGALTLWLKDERFFKMKPTILYLFFAGALYFGLWRGKSYMAYLMEEVLPLKHEGWMILTRRVAAFFLVLAVLNTVIALTLSDGIWVTFKTFGLTIAIFGFFMTQGRVFAEYAVEENKAD